MYKNFTITIIFFLFCIPILAQNQGVSIGKGRTPAHTKSILELVSSDKGILIPRMTTTERKAIFSSDDLTANGLMVYDNEENSFYFWDGKHWHPIRSGSHDFIHGSAMPDVNSCEKGDMFYNETSKVLYVHNTTEWTIVNNSTDELQTLSQVLSLGTDAGLQRIEQLGDPINSQDAATKKYVDESIAVVDASASNEIQDLQLVGNVLKITNNGTATEIDLSKYLDNVDTKLTEAEVDALVGNNGYLTSETDGSVTNEIQDLQLVGNELKITNNGTATEIDLSKYLDNVDTKLTEAEVDALVGNNGYLTSETDGSVTNEIQDLQLVGNVLKITNNGTATEIDLSKYLDNVDTKLTEAEVDALVANNGYLTGETDGSVTNEIQDLQLVGNVLKITNNGTATEIDLSKYLDNTDTKLTEAEVDALVANNGYLTGETDGSVTNEIQDLQLVGNVLKITNNGKATEIDLSKYLDNVDTKLTEAEVDALVANNGYLTGETDGSVTNEIQDLQLVGNVLKITNNGTATEIDLSKYLDNVDTKLTEAEVDALVANNGYLTGETDGSVTNEIQDLQLVGNVLKITNNGTATEIDLSKYLDNTDTKLTEAEVDALVANNGYLTSETDGSVSNEIQDLELTGNVLKITNNGTATEIDLSKYLDNIDTKLTEAEVDALVANNGYLTAETDGSISNEIQDLQLNGNVLKITNNGTATEIDLSKYLDDSDTKLTEAEVDALVANNGYLTTETDGSVSNEIQDLQLTGNVLKITNNGTATEIDLSKYLDDTDTKLTEAEVDALVANNGYLTAETDGSISNEIQDLQLNGNVLKITKNGTATEIDLSKYLDNTDTKLTEAEVDALVANNGYLTSETDGSVSNEIQDLQLTGNVLKITNNGTATEIDLSKYLDDTDTKLTEAEVDALVANNGYLTTETDGSVSNEIQDLQLTGNMLKITNNGTATEIDLSKYLDNTDTKLTEVEVDAMVANNGYLTSETDGSVSNEIQDLQLTGNVLKITNNGTATEIDLSKYLDNIDTKLTEAEVDALVANNGYLTTETDGSVSNEIQDLQLTGNVLKITNNGTATEIDLSKYLDDTKLNETEVDVLVANNGYLTAEVDGSVSNEIQDLQLIGNVLKITDNGTATEIDLSKYLDNIDTKLTEAEVDALVANNGYLTSETDGSVSNEIQDLQLTGNVLKITNNGTATEIDLSKYLDNIDTKLTEAEVDALVANNGYLTSETDGSVSNEIQDLQLTGNVLKITNNGTATEIDLSKYLDNTDTKLTEVEVDAMVANNGYLTTETDDQTAGEVAVTASGNLSSTNVQSALEELQSDLDSRQGDILKVGSMESGDAFADASADDQWLGLGSSAGRIEFDNQTTNEVNILDAYVGIGTNTPGSLLEISSGTHGDAILTLAADKIGRASCRERVYAPV